jgi:competence protein ComEC
MNNPYQIPTWKSSPFIRILIPLIVGIVLQWYLQISLTVLFIAFVCFLLDLVLIRFLPLSFRYRIQTLQGIVINLLLISFGAIVTWQKDIRHDTNWYGNHYQNGNYLLVRVDEPPIEKTKSFKADGYVKAVVQNDSNIDCKGKLLLYFSKDSASSSLHYGDMVLIHKDLQAIKNSGNPGAFDYQRYCAFQGIFQNVFLKKDDWVLLNEKDINPFNQFIFSVREKILSIIRKKVDNSNDEFGIAEALLIGYSNDLDKDLQQAYSNTGVVHVIAVSGMHLGIIYLTIVWLLNKIPLFKRSRVIKLMVLLSCLWILAFVTGASASVFRAATVFSFIAIGKSIDRKSSIYNSLAASAFVLLCCNPYFIWDVGFQLSYLAIISIIVFQKLIYHWVYFKNKIAGKIWELATLTLAVQILLFPLEIYYFHQFPLLFFFTNIIVIPLSLFILYAEILLLIFNSVPYLSIWLGKIITWSIGYMNKFIVSINSLSFSVIDNLTATVLSTCLLYAMVLGFSVWLINKSKPALRLSLVFTLLFSMFFAYNKWMSAQQNKLIVYNVPQHKAIDFINGNKYQFVGDSILMEDGLLQNFHLKPGRIALQLNERTDSLAAILNKGNFYQFNDKRILLVDKEIAFDSPGKKTNIDAIIISKNAKACIPQLASIFNCNEYVFDASNSLWKIDKWKKDCEKLHLRSYSVPDEGAFVLNTE